MGRVDADEHRELAQDVSDFLAGKTAALTRRLEQQMRQAAAAMEYEKAAVLRDRLAALASATESNAIVLADGTDADVIALAEDPLEVAVQIFHVRSGRVRGQRGWVADRTDDADTAQLIESFLLYHYSEAVAESEVASAIPPEILVPVEPASGECSPNCSASSAAPGCGSGCRSAAPSSPCWRRWPATPVRR